MYKGIFFRKWIRHGKYENHTAGGSGNIVAATISISHSYSAVEFDEHLQSFVLVKSSDTKVFNNILKYESKPINIYFLNQKFLLRMCNYVDCNANVC